MLIASITLNLKQRIPLLHAAMCASHIDTHLEIDRECRFRAKLYQETD